MEVDPDAHLPLCHSCQVSLSHLILSLCCTKSCQQLWLKNTLLLIVSSSLSSTNQILDAQLG